MEYFIAIRFQGCEYRTIETYSSYTAASDEAHRRFDGTPVQWDVFTDEASLEKSRDVRATHSVR